MLNAASASPDKLKLERTLAIIKPDAAKHEDAITVRLLKAGFTISSRRKVQLTPEQASDFYAEHARKPFYTQLVNYMSSGPAVAMILTKTGAIGAWRQLLGPTDPVKARQSHPESIRALFGTDGTRNAAHGSDSAASAERETRFFFPNSSFFDRYLWMMDLAMFHPLPSKQDAKTFLDAALYPTLTQGLTELCKHKPENPTLWLGEWLLANNPSKPRVIEPEDDE